MKTRKSYGIKRSIPALMLLALFQIGLLSAQSHSYSTDDSKIALEGYSPVSYIDDGKAQLGKKDYKSTFDGVTYYFINQAQKDRFEANPSKYKAQYGGWCAFAVSLGGKFQPDHQKFRIVNGKLYLFTKNPEGDFVEVWEKEGKEKHIMQADENWQTMDKFKS